MSIVIALAALLGAAQGYPCTYSGKGDIVTVQECGWIGTDGDWHLQPEQLAKLHFDSHGLSALYLDKWYVVRRDGRMAPVMAFDNWAEGFSNGLARSPRGGKIGFIDRSLRLAIPARYDGAYRFDQGRAVVCTGCREATHGEHTFYAGGRWGCIDRRGREIVPMRRLGNGEDVAALCGNARP